MKRLKCFFRKITKTSKKKGKEKDGRKCFKIKVQ